ncbi:hypothetical protein GMRT_11960 [Giardia muris]|uniref:Uncharacterized protein n=1 Tax=Giardia muris TaxID=5742 RepID=A0A4Z1T7T5_GIAMU|nr:hypothetical protein GMRT_11960 [Giardia muris]|eukprot:TNJ29217.1 hypothetical protein GMRT_11960 [Giardia muris]
MSSPSRIRFLQSDSDSDEVPEPVLRRTPSPRLTGRAFLPVPASYTHQEALGYPPSFQISIGINRHLLLLKKLIGRVSEELQQVPLADASLERVSSALQVLLGRDKGVVQELTELSDALTLDSQLFEAIAPSALEDLAVFLLLSGSFVMGAETETIERSLVFYGALTLFELLHITHPTETNQALNRVLRWLGAPNERDAIYLGVPLFVLLACPSDEKVLIELLKYLGGPTPDQFKDYALKFTITDSENMTSRVTLLIVATLLFRDGAQVLKAPVFGAEQRGRVEALQAVFAKVIGVLQTVVQSQSCQYLDNAYLHYIRMLSECLCFTKIIDEDIETRDSKE